MKQKWIIGFLLTGLINLFGCTGDWQMKESKPSQVAHIVFFTLNDNAPPQKERLVQECYTYLNDHPGVEYFSAGTIAQEMDRPVNVKDFDVSLHVIFTSQADHDRYQTAEDHLTFIERNKANWKQVRVFDSHVY